MPPATPMRKGFLLAAAADADPLGDARSGEDVCDGRRTMLLLSIVIEIPGRRRFKLWREERRLLKIRDDEAMKAAAEGARMSLGLLSCRGNEEAGCGRPVFCPGQRPPAARQHSSRQDYTAQGKPQVQSPFEGGGSENRFNVQFRNAHENKMNVGYRPYVFSSSLLYCTLCF